jgi:hypothetical protein
LKTAYGGHLHKIRDLTGKIQDLDYDQKSLLRSLDVKQNRIEDAFDAQIKKLTEQLAEEKRLINNEKEDLKKVFKSQFDELNAEKSAHESAVDNIKKSAGPIDSAPCDLSGMAPAEREALYQKADQICSELMIAHDAQTKLIDINNSKLWFNVVPALNCLAAWRDPGGRQQALRKAFQSLDRYRKTIASRESKSNDFDAKYALYMKTMEELRNNERLDIDDDLRVKMISEKRYIRIKFLREKRYKYQNSILEGEMYAFNNSLEEFKYISCLNLILSRCDSLDTYAQKYSKERLLKYIADVRGQVSMIKEQVEQLVTPNSEEELDRLIADSAKIKFEQDQYMRLGISTLCRDLLTP